MRDSLTNGVALVSASCYAWTPFIEQFHKSVLLPIATLAGILWIGYQIYERRAAKKKAP